MNMLLAYAKVQIGGTWTIINYISYALGVVPLACGYAALVALAVNRKNRYLETFAPVAQMALSNYLFQTVISILLFYGIGFGFAFASGNTSHPLSTLTLESLKPQILADVQDVKLKKVDDKLVLTWDYPDYANHRFMIYKMDNEGDFTMIKKLEGQTSMTMGYNEKAINTYAVRVKGPDGRKSKMSEHVSYDR